MTASAAPSARRPLFASVGAFLLVLCVAVEYAPVLRGRVPFPADIVLKFPPWSGSRPAPRLSHPEEGDIATQAYPWRTHVVHELHRGRIPLWNPAILLGCPMLANAQSAVFDPVNLATAALPGWLAWSVAFPLRALLAGFGAALLADALGATASGAWLSGIVFAFSGFLSNWRGRSPEASGMWLPLVLYAIDRLIRRRDLGTAAFAGAVGAFPLLGGQPEVAFQMALVAGAFALFRLALPPVSSEPVSRAAAGRRLLLAALVAMTLCLVQLAPTLEWVSQLDRRLHPWGHFPLRWIVTFLSRNRLASPERDGYAGMITLFLVPFALCGRRRDSLFFAVLLFAAVEIVFGLPPFGPISDVLPVLSGIPNGRFFLAADLSLAVLAGLGLSALERGDGPPATRNLALVAAVGLAMAAALVVLPVPKPTDESDRTAVVRSTESEAWILLGLLPIAALAATRLPKRGMAAAALVVAAADIVTFQHERVPLVPRDEVYPPAAALERARGLASEGARIATTDATMGSNFEMMYGITTPAGYDFPLRRTARVLKPILVPNSNLPSAAAIVRTRPHGLFDLFGVRIVLATTRNSSSSELDRDPVRFPLLFRDHSVRAYANLTALPRAFFLPETAVCRYPKETGQAAAVLGERFDATRTLVLPGKRSDRCDPSASGPAPLVAATDFAESAGKVAFAIAAPGPGYAVVTETAYPGWRAWIDGRPAPLLRADYAFQAVAVDAGRHRVALAYRPPVFWIGLLVSSAGWFGLAAFALARRSRPSGSAFRRTAELDGSR